MKVPLAPLNGNIFLYTRIDGYWRYCHSAIFYVSASGLRDLIFADDVYMLSDWAACFARFISGKVFVANKIDPYIVKNNLDKKIILLNVCCRL